MFFKGRDEETKNTVINIPCSCGTHSIQLNHFDDDIEEIYLSFYVDRFYIQDGILSTICKRVKQAFMALCGKSYRFEEMVLSEEDLEKLEQEIHNILQTRKEKKDEQN